MGRKNKNKKISQRISMQPSADASKISNNTSLTNENKVTADMRREPSPGRITNLFQQKPNTGQNVESETKIAENPSADNNLLINKDVTNGNSFNVSLKNAVPDSRVAISSRYIINPRERLWHTDNKWYVKVLPTASSSTFLTKEQIAGIYQRFGTNFTDNLDSPLLMINHPSIREVSFFYNMDFLDKTNVVKNLAAISSRVFEAQMFAGFKIRKDFARLKSNMPSINKEHLSELFVHCTKVSKELVRLKQNQIIPNNKKLPAFSKKPRVVRVKFIRRSKSTIKVNRRTSVQSTSWSVLARKKLQQMNAIFRLSTLTTDSVLTNQDKSTQKTLNRNYFEELNLILRNNECSNTTTSDKSSVKVKRRTSVKSTSWSVFAKKKLQQMKAIYCPSTLTSDSVLTNHRDTSTQKTLNRNYFEELNLVLRNNECSSMTTSDDVSNYDGVKPKSSSVDQSSNENTSTNLNIELKSNQHGSMTLNKPLDYGTNLLSTSSDHRYNDNISEELDMFSTNTCKTPNKYSDYVHQKLESKSTDKFSDKMNDDISCENITSPTCVQFADHCRQHNTFCKPITINTESFDFENLKTSIQVDNLSNKSIAYKENSYDKQLGSMKLNTLCKPITVNTVSSDFENLKTSIQVDNLSSKSIAYKENFNDKQLESMKEKTIRLKLTKSSVKSIKNKLKIGNIEDFNHLLADVKNLLKKTKCKKIDIKIDTKETRKNLTKMAVSGEDTSESLWEDISEPVSEDDNSELIDTENSKYNKTDIVMNTKEIKYLIKKDISRENSSEPLRSDVSEPSSEKGNEIIGTKKSTENFLKYNANKYFVEKQNILKNTPTNTDNIKKVSIDDTRERRNIPKDNTSAMQSINTESQTDSLIFKNLKNDVEYFIENWPIFCKPLAYFVSPWDEIFRSQFNEESNYKPKHSDLIVKKISIPSSSKIKGGVAVDSSKTYVKTANIEVSEDKVKTFSQLSTGNKTVSSTSVRLETAAPLRNASRESSLKSSIKNQSTVKESCKNKTEKISANKNEYRKFIPPRDIYKFIFDFNSNIKLQFEHLRKLYTQIVACLNRCEWVMYIRPFLRYLEEKEGVIKNCYMLIEKVVFVFEKSHEISSMDDNKEDDIYQQYRLLVAHLLLTKTYFYYVKIYLLILRRFLRSCYENNHKLTTIKKQ